MVGSKGGVALVALAGAVVGALIAVHLPGGASSGRYLQELQEEVPDGEGMVAATDALASITAMDESVQDAQKELEDLGDLFDKMFEVLNPLGTEPGSNIESVKMHLKELNQLSDQLFDELKRKSANGEEDDNDGEDGNGSYGKGEEDSDSEELSNGEDHHDEAPGRQLFGAPRETGSGERGSGSETKKRMLSSRRALALRKTITEKRAGIARHLEAVRSRAPMMKMRAQLSHRRALALKRSITEKRAAVAGKLKSIKSRASPLRKQFQAVSNRAVARNRRSLAPKGKVQM